MNRLWSYYDKCPICDRGLEEYEAVLMKLGEEWFHSNCITVLRRIAESIVKEEE